MTREQLSAALLDLGFDYHGFIVEDQCSMADIVRTLDGDWGHSDQDDDAFRAFQMAHNLVKRFSQEQE